MLTTKLGALQNKFNTNEQAQRRKNRKQKNNQIRIKYELCKEGKKQKSRISALCEQKTTTTKTSEPDNKPTQNRKPDLLTCSERSIHRESQGKKSGN